MEITELNDDVLLEILTWVNVTDSINFINSCHRMQSLSDMYAKKFSNYDFTSMDKHMSLKEVNHLLHIIGKSLTKLDTSKMQLNFYDGNAIVKAITKQCRKLQELTIDLPYYMMLREPLPGGLKSLSLYSCELESDAISEKLFKGSWKSLQTLRMFDMMYLKGSFLEKFQALQELELENFPALIQSNLVNCLRQNKTLRSLTIRSCPLINEGSVARISTFLTDLEVLKLDIFSKSIKTSLGALNKLENLQILRLEFIGTDSTSFENSLISTISANKSLKELFINGAKKLTANSIKELFSMKNLQKLEFSDCLFVDKQFLLMLGDAIPLTEVIFSRIQHLTDDALLAFAVKTHSLERLHILLCPVSLKVKTEIANTIQKDVYDGKRTPLIVNIQRPVG